MSSAVILHGTSIREVMSEKFYLLFLLLSLFALLLPNRQQQSQQQQQQTGQQWTDLDAGVSELGPAQMIPSPAYIYAYMHIYL